MIENGQLMGGIVEIDMNKTEGRGHGRDNNLINNLKGPDFFDVKKFPISTIAITRVESINGENKKVTGNLTIKGITHPVTFSARIEVKGGTVKAIAKLIIDRTDWGIRYRSGKFYDNLADLTVSDDIEFQIKNRGKEINSQISKKREQEIKRGFSIKKLVQSFKSEDLSVRPPVRVILLMIPHT